ncbi:hypothetical protein DRJ48_02920 [Candidatus Woesearchaeota archaeon]|nr:hypothetical protein [Candidatus Woesearchaeota archaeon]RLE42741.1 MAG: hypothetical protein DRJ48_02920 [Candidatus Woesearchaeota archaeon]
MEANEEKVLEELGLSQNESKVYLTLLELGSTTAGEIAKKSKVHRTNVYDALEGLMKRGLASYIIKDRTKYFEASPPEDLLRYLQDKEERLKEILPKLNLIRELSEKKSQAHVYEGLKAFINLNYGWLRYREPILVFGIPKGVVEKYLKFDIPKWHKKRIALKIVMKHIYNENAKERIRYLNSLPYTEAGYLPERFNSDVSTVTCGDEVVLVFWMEPIMMIQIINKKIAQSYKNYFELLWSHCKKPD